MYQEMNGFIQAHDRYVALDLARTECTSPAQREYMHILILEAYLEVQCHARRLQFAGGSAYQN